MKFYLDRDYRTDIVTLGYFYSAANNFGIDLGDSRKGVHSLELPWKGNQQKISCVPTGIYECVRSMYYGGDGVGGKKDYECFELVDVPGRTEVKIHVGNYPHNFEGCIGLGMARSEDPPAIWSSGKAFALFMDYCHGVDSFQLEIRDV